MAKTYNVRLYYNTGFDTGNVPANEGVLASFSYRDFNAAYLFQSSERTSLKIEAEWDDVKNADYMRLSNGADVSYYVIAKRTMLTNRTAQLDIVQDPLLSGGGIDAFQIVGGWAERAHVKKDEMFGNVLPEPWQPSQRLIIRDRELIHEKGSGLNFSIAGATCDLVFAELYATLVTAIGQDGVKGEVAWPELPKIQFETVVSYKGHEFSLPGMCLFNMENSVVQSGINAIRGIGIDNAITNMIKIPADDVNVVYESIQEGDEITVTPRIVSIIGKSHLYDGDGRWDYAYGEVKNKKALCLYNAYTVTSISSANNATFKAQELYSGGRSPQFRVDVDPAPNGTVYCQPTWFEGKETQYQEHSVAGMAWLNAGFVFQSSSGSALTMANARRQNLLTSMQEDYAVQGYNLQDIQTGTELALGVAERLTDPSDMNLMAQIGSGGLATAHAAVGAAQMVSDATFRALNTDLSRRQVIGQSEFAMGDRLFNAAVTAHVVAPEIAFPVDVNASAYFGNAFMISHTTLGNNDLGRFDKFLTMYGYAVDKPVTRDDFVNREKFNYIKTKELQVTSQTAPLSLCRDVENMFNNGVRIWHIAPVGSAYDDNPVRS